MSEDAFLKLDALRKVYDETVAVEAVTMDIARGEYVVLLGPSGSGKTTLLSMIGGFTPPTSGSLRIDQEDVTNVPPARRPTVTVFQDYALFPHMSVTANVEFGLQMRRMRRTERAGTVAEALELVGLGDFGDRRIHQLSGGQRQRVALARAIAVKPSVLLLDEPLGALDMNLRRQMQDELVGIQRQLGTTFVHVTHDQDEAMNIADRLVVMKNGRIEDTGPPDRVYLRPATRFSATFMGESNILAARVTKSIQGRCQVETQFGSFSIPGTPNTGSDAHISIRPEHFRLDAVVGSVPFATARVEDFAFNGTHRRCIVSVDGVDDTLMLRLPVEMKVSKGETLGLSVRPEDITLLAE